jgi:predicted nucleotidyltransferase component of viral defense system
MISFDRIKNYYPASMAENSVFQKHILTEYVQLLTLDYLSTTEHIRKMTFIGGTNLRLTRGIDRFSKDLDFDCKNLTEKEFIRMSDDVLTFLRRSGFNVEARAREKSGLKAFRRSLYFPELLFSLGISGHREARFLLKIEVQHQQAPYEPVMEFIKGCGLFFPFPVPSEAVLCAMKVADMLARAKGRDYYDVMFLLSRTEPDYQFLGSRFDIHNLAELKTAVEKSLQTVDLRRKQKDFEHLLLHRDNSRRILHFAEFIRSL